MSNKSFITGSSPANMPGQAAPLSASELNDIGDVNVPNPSTGYILKWSGSQWEQTDTALFAAKVSGVDASGNATYYGKNSAGTIGFHAIPVPKSTLNSLDDVSVSPAVLNYVLSWNGTAWVDVENSAANTTFDDTNVSYTAATVQEAIEAIDAVEHPVSYGENLLINSNMSVWQRGTTYKSQTYPSVDRWRRWSSAMDKMDRVDVSDDDIGAVYSVKTRLTLSGNHGMFQRIEAERAAKVTGKITVSFWAKVASGTAQPITYIATPSAKDNWASFSANPSPQVGTITTEWKRFVYTLDVTERAYPASNGLAIGVACTAGTVECEFANIKAEIGDTATDYVPPSTAENLALCQRYYFVTNGYHSQEANATAGGQFFSSYVMYPTTMRITPAMTSVSETLTNCTNPGFFSITDTGFRREAQSVVAGRCILNSGTYNADAEL